MKTRGTRGNGCEEAASKTDEGQEQPQSRLFAAFLRYRAALGREVSRIVRPHEIDDVLQETFIRAYAAADKTEIRHPRAFLSKTARNVALNHVTSSPRLVDFEPDEVYSVSEAVESQFESRELFLLFCRSVRALPLQCRRVFVLKKVYGLSQREIAEYLGLSESTVEKHVAKGLMMCRKFMASVGANMGGPTRKEGSERKRKGETNG